MAYTPELSYEESCTLRRLAWAMRMPMTKAIGEVINHAAGVVDRVKVCEACRDKTKCRQCVFGRN
ncbi:MAG: hypothetical protein JW882_05820 [Deltaproteobacteria bacterium]|nr:hypothetical protein [Deltaproteobacteria bacterium]